MYGGQPESAQERVQRALEQLGTDTESAAPVPDGVTARIITALRAERPRTAHSVVPPPRLGRLRIAAVIVGVVAVAAAIAVGVLVLSRQGQDTAPRFPVGPTADQITVSVSRGVGDPPDPAVTHP